MAERRTIQATVEVAEKVDKLKPELRASTGYDVIDKLCMYYAKKPNHVLMDNNVRDEFRSLGKHLGIREESDLLKLLLTHWNYSQSFQRETLEMMRDLR